MVRRVRVDGVDEDVGVDENHLRSSSLRPMASSSRASASRSALSRSTPGRPTERDGREPVAARRPCPPGGETGAQRVVDHLLQGPSAPTCLVPEFTGDVTFERQVVRMMAS